MNFQTVAENDCITIKEILCQVRIDFSIRHNADLFMTVIDRKKKWLRTVIPHRSKRNSEAPFYKKFTFRNSQQSCIHTFQRKTLCAKGGGDQRNIVFQTEAVNIVAAVMMFATDDYCHRFFSVNDIRLFHICKSSAAVDGDIAIFKYQQCAAERVSLKFHYLASLKM